MYNKKICINKLLDLHYVRLPACKASTFILDSIATAPKFHSSIERIRRRARRICSICRTFSLPRGAH